MVRNTAESSKLKQSHLQQNLVIIRLKLRSVLVSAYKLYSRWKN